MTIPSLRPLRRDAEANLQRILDATTRVMALQGLDFSMEDIAREAACGVGTIYRRFASKDELLHHQFHALRSQVSAVAEAAMAHEDALAGLETLMVRLGTAMAGNHGLRDLVMGSPQFRADALAARRQLRPVITTLFTRARDAGQLRAGIEATDLSIIVAMMAEVIALTASAEPDLWRRYLAIAIDGIRSTNTAPLLGRAPTPRELTRMIQMKKARHCSTAT